MDKNSLIEKIRKKKDFSKLPLRDVEAAFNKFQKRECSDEEKIDLTRNLLRRVFSAFASSKILSLKNKSEEWILRKHLSTRERLEYYPEVYSRILGKSNKKIRTIIDLGAGINGFSYKYFPKGISYLAIESVGQLVNLMNFYFKNKKLNAKAVHESLFELEKIKKLIQFEKGEKIVFLFKVIDSLEMLEENYSKELLKEIVPLADKVILSFATQSMIRRDKFRVNRNWIRKFLYETFEILDEFEIGGEKYIVFRNK